MKPSPQDILITGAGLATCLGLSRQDTFAAMLQGRCGVGHAPAMEATFTPDPGSGQAPDLPEDFAKDLPREVRYLRHAIMQALTEAGMLHALPCPPQRCGVMLATTLHGMRAGGQFLRTFDPAVLRHLPAGQAVRLATAAIAPLQHAGFMATTCNACASGLSAIAMGMMMLQSHQYDVVIAGGYDTLSEYALAGFGSLRLIAPGAQKPFARDRAGLKLGEGYGVVILQRASDVKTSHQPLARLAGAGEASDAHHLSKPCPQGSGSVSAMTRAIHHAGLSPEKIELIVAHATATPDNDAAEYAALSRVFGEALPAIPVAAMKSHLGHTLGGAGAVELILACESMHQKRVPPAANVKADDIEFAGLDLVTYTPRSLAPQAVLCLSAGFGGANTAIILTPATQPTTTPPAVHASSYKERAVITGVGVVAPGLHQNLLENKAFFEHLQSRDPAGMLLGPIDPALLDAHLDPAKTRRISQYVKLTLVAILRAMQQAGLDCSPPHQRDDSRSAAILATTHGSVAMSAAYYQPVVQQGLHAGNPLLFAEGVPNAGAAHLSMVLGFTGPCQTLLGTRTAGLDALHLARLAIEQGRCDRVLIAAADECSPLVDMALRSCNLCAQDVPGKSFAHAPAGFATVDAGCALVLEAQSVASKRSQPMLASLGDSASIAWSPTEASQATQPIAAMMQRLAQSITQDGTQPALPLLTSANATWLDHFERLAIKRMLVDTQGHAAVTSLYGHMGECFSALPLLGLAAFIHNRKLPALVHHELESSSGLKAATSAGTPSQACVLASDYHGLTTGLTLRLAGEKR